MWVISQLDNPEMERALSTIGSPEESVMLNPENGRLVSEVALDAGPREDDDAVQQDIEHLVVALERCGLGVLGSIGLEGDPRHFAIVGPHGFDQFGALGRSAMQQDDARVLGADLVVRVPSPPSTRGAWHRPR